MIVFSEQMIPKLLDGSKTQTRRLIRFGKPCCKEDSRVERGVPHNRHQLVDERGAPNLAGSMFGTDPYLACPACPSCDCAGNRLRGRFFVDAVHGVGEVYRPDWWSPDHVTIEYKAGGMMRACTPPNVEEWVSKEEPGLKARGWLFDIDDDGAWTPPTEPDGKSGGRWPWRNPRYMPRWAARLDVTILDVRIERLGDITDHDAKAEGLGNRSAFVDGFRAIHKVKPGVEWDPWLFCYTFRAEQRTDA